MKANLKTVKQYVPIWKQDIELNQVTVTMDPLETSLLRAVLGMLSQNQIRELVGLSGINGFDDEAIDAVTDFYNATANLCKV